MKGRRTNNTTPTTGKTITSEPPEWLSDHAKTVWRQTLADLEEEGRPLGRLNAQALVGFCDAAGLVRECAETLALHGMTIDGGREGMKRHPAVTTRISALNSLRAYAIELGLTPGTAGRIKITPPEEENEFDSL